MEVDLFEVDELMDIDEGFYDVPEWMELEDDIEHICAMLENFHFFYNLLILHKVFNLSYLMEKNSTEWSKIARELSEFLQIKEDKKEGIASDNFKIELGGGDAQFASHLGGNVYISVSKDYPFVNIRQFWKPKKCDDVKPTRKGDTSEVLPDFISEFKDRLPCWMGDDHLNQLGFIYCTECNPNGEGQSQFGDQQWEHSGKWLSCSCFGLSLFFQSDNIPPQ
ncbi:hypothetical protein KUTeg_022217 [Tegillarca granosa]|uniref:Uncharacterized protein n=1 Tax=Tegillarca granosa TaxID=220873 RepID=A0ABQ9E5K6_TEGGR|nr:hypothetical protein KUTeg_022217 [Tegillarca granosa]